MAVGLGGLPVLFPVPGIRLGITCAGIRKKDRRDLVVIECVAGTEAAAVFTQNRFCAAPVIVARDHLVSTQPRALVINTGYANAGTGEAGLADAHACCRALATLLGVPEATILPFSTGVIGERLPVDRIVTGLPACLTALSADAWTEAAHGIMTTDTVPKGASVRIALGGHSVTITGIAKGAGMIHPNMATMLGFIATDAKVMPGFLSGALKRCVAVSFNSITVDGDTSTNDACVLLASGQAGNTVLQGGDADSRAFEAALTEVCIRLAQAIVRDAEGATKFVTIEVEGAECDDDAHEVARTIAHSPLVKTALFASDPNWGRILAAVGRAPIARLDVNRVALSLNGVCIAREGARAPEYTEEQGAREMARPEIVIGVSLGCGSGRARMWTCDFSHDYVRINAEYRT